MCAVRVNAEYVCVRVCVFVEYFVPENFGSELFNQHNVSESAEHLAKRIINTSSDTLTQNILSHKYI